MDDLRDALFQKIHKYLAKEVFPVKHTGIQLLIWL